MATATTPTTSTTVGLLSLCSNLLTYSWALPFYHGPSGLQRITQTAKPRSQAPLFVAACTSQNTPTRTLCGLGHEEI
jgi:hypothetical protein